MSTFEATTSIGASPRHVWRTLIRTDRWPDWDPALERVDGTPGEGASLCIHVSSASRPFRVRVTTWEPDRRIVVAGGMPFGLFTGTREYRLEPDGAGTVFAVSERYTGPLAPLIGRTLPDLQPSFEAFASGLRAAAEQYPSAPNTAGGVR